MPPLRLGLIWVDGQYLEGTASPLQRPRMCSCTELSFFPDPVRPPSGKAWDGVASCLVPCHPPASDLGPLLFPWQVLPIIVFFSCVMSVLYYLGLMQWVILKVSLKAIVGVPAHRAHGLPGYFVP